MPGVFGQEGGGACFPTATLLVTPAGVCSVPAARGVQDIQLALPSVRQRGLPHAARRQSGKRQLQAHLAVDCRVRADRDVRDAEHLWQPGCVWACEFPFGAPCVHDKLEQRAAAQRCGERAAALHARDPSRDDRPSSAISCYICAFIYVRAGLRGRMGPRQRGNQPRDQSTPAPGRCCTAGSGSHRLPAPCTPRGPVGPGQPASDAWRSAQIAFPRVFSVLRVQKQREQCKFAT